MLKFAVVREDPAVELDLAQRTNARRLLTVASGGCTALSLKHALPTLEVHAFDLNPDQLAHCRARALAIAEGRHTELNVRDASPAGLSQCGEFEKLFRVLRDALLELVMPVAELEQFFSAGSDRVALLAKWRQLPYWSSAFESAFTESLLHAMFGPDATRHAPRGSYPAYFQRVFERGLSQPGAASNPWLQHVLLQRYEAPPAFLTSGRLHEVHWHEGTLTSVPELSRFDVVSLSNIFDWSDESLVVSWAEALEALPRGSLVVWRQLNNQRDWRPHFAPNFVEETALSKRWSEDERALFYERVTVVRRA
jgi:S-adenosylmethionine-diacylglycerol 3-amino-3-carboxypropyl transferase